MKSDPSIYKGNGSTGRSRLEGPLKGYDAQLLENGRPRGEKSIQRFMAALHGHAQVLLDHLAENAQLPRDFVLREILEPAHLEDLVAAGRKVFHGLNE